MLILMGKHCYILVMVILYTYYYSTNCVCVCEGYNIHTQVYTVSPSLVERVLQQLVLLIAEEILRVFRSIENFSHNGALHVSILYINNQWRVIHTQ